MDYEVFIKTYQVCQHDYEVAEQLDISVGYVATLASKLRKAGVPLKYRRKNYHRFGAANLERLKKVALHQEP